MTKIITMKNVHNILNPFLPSTLHQKRKESIYSAVFGLLFSVRLRSSSIGRSLAVQTGKTPKHCIKQVDRLLGNNKWIIPDCFFSWVPKIVGPRKNIVVTMDWSEFCYTGHYLLSINLVSKHGRSAPLLWKSVDDRRLKNNRTKIEMDLLSELHNILSNKVKVTVLADRGFCSTQLFEFIDKALDWAYVIRLKKNHYIENMNGDLVKVIDFVPKNGKVKLLKNIALMKTKKYIMKSVTLVKKAKAKEAWILASNLHLPGKAIVTLYSKRFTCEENFRDIKDGTFGLGLKNVIVTTEDRLDRILFLYAYANLILTLLGATGEKLKYSFKIKANTSKKRTHSLFRQGREYILGVKKEFVDKFRKYLYMLLKNMAFTKTRYAIL